METTPVIRNWKLPVKYPFETVLCLLIISLVGVTFTQVVFRYLLKLSLAWSEELARFLLMWLGALSAAYAFKTKSHFALRFLVDRFSTDFQRIIGTLVALVLTVFLGVFIYQAFMYTISVRNQIAPGTQWSMSVPYSSALVGGVLMLYYILRNWWTDYGRPPQTPENQ